MSNRIPKRDRVSLNREADAPPRKHRNTVAVRRDRRHHGGFDEARATRANECVDLLLEIGRNGVDVHVEMMGLQVGSRLPGRVECGGGGDRGEENVCGGCEFSGGGEKWGLGFASALLNQG